ncbi:MAG: FtsX-like permease family protein, partial [Clostridiales bacterium]|nr:FtsX-like permease family protein [Clostridiales bacterium]
MFRLMLQKIIHKKWMVLCLLIGNILLIAVTVSQPMYRSASFQRMLSEEFKEEKEETDRWPAALEAQIVSVKSDSLLLMQEYITKQTEKIQIPIYKSVDHYYISGAKANSTLGRDDAEEKSVRLGYLSDIKEHITMLSGSVYGDSMPDDGAIQVIVSEAALVDLDVLMNEELEFVYLKDRSGNPIKIRIVGVFTASDPSDDYWVNNPDEYNIECFMAEGLFQELFLGDNVVNYSICGEWYRLFDYEQIEPTDVNRILKTTDQITNSTSFGGKISSISYLSVLPTYQDKANKIKATLFILQVPAVVLLCAFLFMISDQMLLMEQNEISMLKSRGAGRGQIISIYLMQGFFLAGLSYLAGVPLGRFLCALLGSSRAFLEFNLDKLLIVDYSLEAFLYGLVAVLVSVTMTVIPVIKYSRVTIVNLKQEKARRKAALWQKIGLDFILIIISLYGYYYFSQNAGMVAEDVLIGKSLDPLLYFSASFFILGMGFFYLRIQPLIIKLLYLIRKKHLSSSAYTSYIGTIRTGNKQQFIMLFMVLTVSLGIFHVTVAHTIIANGEKNLEYISGADLMAQEVWENNAVAVAMNPDIKFQYYEPEYGRFGQIEGVTGTAKVLYETVTMTTTQKNEITPDFMGIETKDFGTIAKMPEELLPYEFYEYLNVLVSNESTVLVSENFMLKNNYRIGDSISVSNKKGKQFMAKICGFFNYWPGYVPEEYSINGDGTLTQTDNYLIVANLSYVQKQWDVTPYQVWMSLEDNADGFYQWVEDYHIKLTSYRDSFKEKEAIKEDTLYQGTNGILTMSFIVILILCSAGYLIYWIMSIRSRELLFGILRAMGMSKNNIFSILIHEQIFSGLFSMAAGLAIGCLASFMYVPIIQNAYAASNQVLPLTLMTNSKDLIRLFLVIGVVLLICLVILIRIINQS